MICSPTSPTTLTTRDRRSHEATHLRTARPRLPRQSAVDRGLAVQPLRPGVLDVSYDVDGWYAMELEDDGPRDLDDRDQDYYEYDDEMYEWITSPIEDVKVRGGWL